MSTYRDLGIPTSSSTVTVKVFDSIQAGDHGKVSIPAENFYAPILPGHTKLACPVFAFLIEHPASGTRVMFDLGLRKDLENAAPPSAAFFQQVLPNSERDVVDLLAVSGVPGESLSAVIWSHAHADHSGDMSRLPKTVDLVISKDLSTATYETDPHSVLLPSDFAGRKLVKIDFDTSKLKIGGFRAHDYFGDGSMYLLDVPGHQAGHICGLVRVTPTTFLLLGGDACHHPGALRPTQAHQKHFPCPGALVEAVRKSVSAAHFSSGSVDAPFDLLARDKPVLHVHEAKFHADAQLAQTSVDALAVFDGNPDVFVVLAHDSSLLPLFDNNYPVVLNAWKEKGWKERNVWAFLQEGNPAFRFDVRE
uniref:Metallo-beta-lactamase superfamily protein n=1 Tax=Mycena chlorophos TaxID=658473 RepID=A0ABQ0KYD8_MYCCL|nr:metallo-beta-lactamase superfamily protein [Mycena chlorophos]